MLSFSDERSSASCKNGSSSALLADDRFPAPLPGTCPGRSSDLAAAGDGTHPSLTAYRWTRSGTVLGAASRWDKVVLRQSSRSPLYRDSRRRLCTNSPSYVRKHELILTKQQINNKSWITTQIFFHASSGEQHEYCKTLNVCVPFISRISQAKQNREIEGCEY